MAHAERGFTLVEVIVAITLLTVGLLSLATATTLATRMLTHARRTTAATLFAEQRLERIRGTVCAGAVPSAGVEQAPAGAVGTMSNSWRLMDLGARVWRVELTTTFRAAQGRVRRHVWVTAAAC